MKINELPLDRQWEYLLDKLQHLLDGKRPNDVNAVLFLIGVQELGQGASMEFSKEQKQDLMHIATCKLLSYAGIYELDGQDQEGWPLWVLAQPLPHLDLEGQENLLKMHAIEYFEELELF